MQKPTEKPLKECSVYALLLAGCRIVTLVADHLNVHWLIHVVIEANCTR